MSVRVRPVEPADLPAFVAIRNAVTPDWSTSLDELDWASRTYPGGARLVAEDAGRPIGVANVGRIYEQPPDYPWWWAEITVLPDARRRGAGGLLLAAVSRHAAAAGKIGLQLPTWEDRPEGADFLGHRGFTEFERAKAVRLDLAGIAVPAVELAPGVRLTTLAAEPGLLAGVHAVAVEAFADVPGGDGMVAGGLDEFRQRDVERPGIVRDGFFVAVAEVSGEVIGYASLAIEGGRPAVAIHDMTAVVRAWRGRGIARALKAATIRWAKEAGFEALETGNDEANAPMRAVNKRLGYRPLPDVVFFRGPLKSE